MPQEISKNLSEAALEILNQNKKTKLPEGEKFGQDKKLNDKVDKEADCIGNANFEKYKLDVPTATPPGATPPVGSEPMKKLPKQPGEAKSTVDTEVEQAPKGTFANEDIDALMSGENLSEDFKRKATAIFEAAVKAKVFELSEELEEKYIQQLEEAHEEMKEDLTSKIDSYLDYVVESWVNDNQIALEKGIQSEITESFMSSLKQLFEEHYIDIPEEKFDVVEELASKVEVLENKINEEISKNISLKQKLTEQSKKEALYSVCEGLTLTQSEKIKNIAESVEFISESDFIDQMENIKESYFSNTQSVKPASKESLNEDSLITEEVQETKVVDPIIAAYASKLSKTLLK